jgi:hypothetical protein
MLGLFCTVLVTESRPAPHMSSTALDLTIIFMMTLPSARVPSAAVGTKSCPNSERLF